MISHEAINQALNDSAQKALHSPSSLPSDRHQSSRDIATHFNPTADATFTDEDVLRASGQTATYHKTENPNVVHFGIGEPETTPKPRNAPEAPWGALTVLASLGTAYEFGAWKYAAKGKTKGEKRGRFLGAQAIPAILACQILGVAPIGVEQPSASAFTREQALSLITERGSAFTIGNTSAALTDINCLDSTGGFNKITFKNAETGKMFNGAMCTANLSVDGKHAGQIAGIVQDNGNIYLTTEHPSIDVTGEHFKGSLSVLGTDKKLDVNSGFSFEAAKVGNGSELLWFSVGGVMYDTAVTTPTEAVDLFVALIDSPEITRVNDVVLNVINVPEATPVPVITPEQQAKLDEINGIFAGAGVVSPDGSLKDSTGTVVSGLTYDVEEGVFHLEVGNEQVVVSSDNVAFTADGVRVSGYTLNKETNEWSKIEFQVNTDYKEFQACTIPAESLLDKSFTEYLKTLDWPDFDPASLVFQKFVNAGHNNQYENMTYDFYTAPNYQNPNTRPYQRSVFCNTTYGGVYYGVMATRYYVEGMNPKDYPWTVGLDYLGPVGEGETSAADRQSYMDTVVEEMNFPVYKMTNMLFPPPSSGIPSIPDPLPTAFFDKYPDMSARMAAFMAGDPTALDGIALPIEDTTLGKYYK